MINSFLTTYRFFYFLIISNYEFSAFLCNIEIAIHLAVEMEGASVAYVAEMFNIPCSIIRVISDNANHSAQIDFMKFINELSNFVSLYFCEQNII